MRREVGSSGTCADARSRGDYWRSFSAVNINNPPPPIQIPAPLLIPLLLSDCGVDALNPVTLNVSITRRIRFGGGWVVGGNEHSSGTSK